jgi:RecA/RadA recombinase
MNLLMKWSDGSKPQDWGPDTIFVLDSLSALGRAAFEWAKGMNPTSKDPRQWYGTGQKALEDVLSNLTDAAFNANVIVISHVQLQELPDGSVKGYTNALGKAMGGVIPRYFNTLLLAERSGTGENARRKICTVPTGLVDLKTAAPFKLTKDYDLGTGLATIFEKLKETD